MKFFKRQIQHGQTLIETLVATFVLIMGITAAVGLAIFALNTSTNIVKQIVAMGLAREGIEAVRNMRDTNWLKIATPDSTCYNYADTTAPNSQDARCYKAWLNPPGANTGYGNDKGFVLDSQTGNPPSAKYRIDHRPNAVDKFWDLNRESTNKFGLDEGFRQDIAGANFKGYYPSSNSEDGDSLYYRQIVLTQDTTAPYDKDVGPKLKVQSRVWWVDRKCPREENWDEASATCKVELTTYLTNWKNY